MQITPSLDVWDHSVPAPDHMFDDNFFFMNVDDLWALHDFFEQNDEPLPTDLMVAMADRGLFVR